MKSLAARVVLHAQDRLLGVELEAEGAGDGARGVVGDLYPLLRDQAASQDGFDESGGGGLLGLAMSTLGFAHRMTFIINGDGIIAHVIDRPDNANHAEEVLKPL